MSVPHERMGVFGAHCAHQGHDVPTHGDGMGNSTTPCGAAPRQDAYYTPLQVHLYKR